jgi:hypothetical protein
MKFTPLKFANVSNTMLNSSSPSMELDGRGFPHISWMEEKEGHWNLNYKFWDGQEWGFFDYSQAVFRSNKNIINSSFNLTLIDDDPFLCCAVDNESDFLVKYFNLKNGKWVENSFTYNGRIKWIGCFSFKKLNITDEIINSSSSSFDSSSSISSLNSLSSSSSIDSSSSSSIDSSSSSSLSSLSSSSSVDSSSSSSKSFSSVSSSSSSSYSLSSLSSSSSVDSSSSSSKSFSSVSSSSSSASSLSSLSSDSSLSSLSSSSSDISSSSSSYLDNDLFLVIYDENNNLKIFQDDIEITSIVVTIDDVNTIQISSVNKLLAISFVNETINYNFFNICTLNFENISFQEVFEINNEIVDYNMSHTIISNLNSLMFSWIEKDSYSFNVKNIIVNLDNNISYVSSGSLIDSKLITVSSLNDDYKNFGYNWISNSSFDMKSLETDLGIFVAGSKKSIYKYNFEINSFEQENVNFNFNEGGVKIGKPILKNFNEQLKLCFSDDKNIYFLKSESEIENEYNEEIIILGNQRAKYGFFNSNANSNFENLEFDCTWNNKTGDILYETKRPILITGDEQLDPLCESSSGSGSSSSSHSSYSSDTSSSRSISSESSFSNSSFSSFSSLSSLSSDSFSSFIFTVNSGPINESSDYIYKTWTCEAPLRDINIISASPIDDFVIVSTERPIISINNDNVVSLALDGGFLLNPNYGAVRFSIYDSLNLIINGKNLLYNHPFLMPASFIESNYIIPSGIPYHKGGDFVTKSTLESYNMKDTGNWYVTLIPSGEGQVSTSIQIG